MSKFSLSPLALALGWPPLGLSEPRQGLELAIAELYVRGANHTGFEAQGRADVVVDAGAGVVAHDEVVAVVVLHLVDRDGARQGEDTPVAEAADDAAIAKDNGANGVGDSGSICVSSCL